MPVLAFTVAFNSSACFVSYGAIRILLRLVDPFGADWRDSQLPCFPGVDRFECVIEQDGCAFCFHYSFPVVLLWAVHGLSVCD